METKTNIEKVKGKHYEIGNIETIRIIECIVGRDEIPRKPAYAIGNAVKYMLRCGAKKGESWRDDVAKAENYLHRARTGEWMKEAK